MENTLKHIQLLPPELANQIAAGEVVERPSSVVKELVENSLDADATHIAVTLDGGGQRLIRVQDDGIGIAAKELQLALTRHATSKITSLDDLHKITSYGFRGEALASIASVSRFSITSIPKLLQKQKDFKQTNFDENNQSNQNNMQLSPEEAQTEIQDFAWQLKLNNGIVEHNGPATLNAGTLIEVQDLFLCTPARLKFLKTPATEFKRCLEWLTRCLLVKPKIGFKLTTLANNNQSREVLNLPKDQTLEDRLSGIWPLHIVESLRKFDYQDDSLHIYGFASIPSMAQLRNERQFLYVNGRSVSDRLLLQAIREAYKGRLTTRDYPQVVLFVEVDPELVDVNVHPAKSEVRFSQEAQIFRAVFLAIQQAFTPTDILPVANGINNANNLTESENLAEYQEQSLDESLGANLPRENLALQSAMHNVSLANNSTNNFHNENINNSSRVWQKDPWSDLESYWTTPKKMDTMQNAKFGWQDTGQARGQASLDSNSSFATSANLKQNFNTSSNETGLEILEANSTLEKQELDSVQEVDTVNATKKLNTLDQGNNSAFQIESSSSLVDSENDEELAFNPETLSNALSSEVNSPEEADNSDNSQQVQNKDVEFIRLASLGWQYLGQIDATYLVVGTAKGEMILIDQHAAHERILYNRLSQGAFSGFGQRLAIPLEIPLHPSQVEYVPELTKYLETMGFGLECQEDKLIVKSIAPCLTIAKAKLFLQEVLAGQRLDYKDMLTSMACKTAVKANTVLATPEATSLIEQIINAPDAAWCPHGRPAILRWDKNHLEKLFKRKQ